MPLRSTGRLFALLPLLLIAACGGQPAASPTEAPAAPAEPTTAAELPPTEAPAPPPTEAASGPEVLVGDVLDYSLEPHADWADTGKFGWVKFKLHEGRAGGEPVYFIRTDASDADFAAANGLLHVPLLANALQVEGATSKLYLFENGAEGQLPVLSATPADADFTPAYHVRQVTFTGEPELLDSAEAVEAAVAAGTAEIGPANVVVNYPIVRWPGGELPVDTDLDSYLGTGQLVALDTAGMTVTFKLHECYSGARYIVTDTSAVPMAPMMHIAPSAATQKLVDAGAVDAITVFANGVPGSGVMGQQPAVFRNKAGSPAWSPFWNHFTLKWNDGVTPRVLTEQAAIDAAIAAGEAELFNGTPDTHPMGFVVNCPVPILAPNSFDAEAAAGAAASAAAAGPAPADAQAASAAGSAPASASAPETAAYQPTLAENEPAALAAAEAGAIGRPTLVWFHADWCHVCQEIKPAVHAMRSDYQDRVAIVKLDIDQPESRDAVARYRVQGTPTFVLFDGDGRTIERFVGWPGDAQVAALLDRAVAVQ